MVNADMVYLDVYQLHFRFSWWLQQGFVEVQKYFARIL